MELAADGAATQGAAGGGDAGGGLLATVTWHDDREPQEERVLTWKSYFESLDRIVVPGLQEHNDDGKSSVLAERAVPAWLMAASVICLTFFSLSQFFSL